MMLTLFLRPGRSLFYTLVFAAGTPLFVHSKYFLPEPVALLTIVTSFYYLLKFRKVKKTVFIFLSGLSAGYSLLARPDAPIFLLFFILLSVYTAFRLSKCTFVKNSVLFLLGVSVFSTVFLITNYYRYGSYLETGYTQNREEIKRSLEKDIQDTYKKFETSAGLVRKEDVSDENYVAALKYYRQFQSQQKFLEETNKLISEHGDENTAISTNGPVKFIYGIYLILLSPNRSVFFLSPVLIMLLIPMFLNFKRFKIEFILTGCIVAGYLALYALRAPLSYAGSAAWGVRYLLPVYPVMFLGAIFLERSGMLENKIYKRVLIALFGISVFFQIVGSSVNYQSVQMPLEYKCKQIYGGSDMTWAHESRKRMMTGFSSSLLVNNLRIMSGSLTEEQEAYGVETGPNDWFFWQVLKGKGRLVEGKDTGPFKVLLFMLLIAAAGSAYLLFRTAAGEKK